MRRGPRQARVFAAALIGLAAAGCGTFSKRAPTEAAAQAGPPEVVQPPVVVRVKEPVKANCVPRSFPPPPKYPDTDRALRHAGGAADRYQLMAAGRLLRQKRLAELERIIARCRQ